MYNTSVLADWEWTRKIYVRDKINVSLEMPRTKFAHLSRTLDGSDKCTNKCKAYKLKLTNMVFYWWWTSTSTVQGCINRNSINSDIYTYTGTFKD